MEHQFSTDEEAMAWAAGLLEGEGWFTVDRTNTNMHGVPYLYPRVGCSMSDEDVIWHLHDVMGCGHVGGPYNHDNRFGKKDLYTWKVSGHFAAEVMVILFPLMGTRRQGRITEIFAECGIDAASLGEAA